MKTIKDLKAMIAQPASKEWFKKHGAPKHKALQKKKDSGHYVSPQGVRYLSKAEQKAKMKDWPNAKPKGSVEWPKTAEQKRQHQHKFKRAWND
jgi:hypothetical protein